LTQVYLESLYFGKDVGGHDMVVQLLLEKRADVAAKGEDRWKALHLAAGSGHKAVAQLLLEKGADVGG
jgi:ankyrin repeat protein